MGTDNDITSRSGYMDECKVCPHKNYCRAVTGVLIAVSNLEEMHRKKGQG